MSFDPNPITTESTQINKSNLDNSNLNTNAIHHDSSFKKGKKRQQSPPVDPNLPCHVHQLSVELVTHVFSRLDPVSLATAAKVCSYWRHIVNDDSCWRDAFVSYFGCLPYKRLSLESWKTEYILRTHLVRQWTKGRGTVLSFNPKIGSLESMHVDSNEMVVASYEHGVAAKCNPLTGKTNRHLVYSTNEAIRLSVTAAWVDKDRILWGFDTGYITLSVKTKSMSRLKTFSDFHAAPVHLVQFHPTLQDVVVSAAGHEVKVWDVVTNSCCWTLRPVSAMAKCVTCVQVTTDQRVIVAYDDGSIVIWHINMNQVTQLHRSQHQEDFLDKVSELRKEMDDSKVVIMGIAKVTFMAYDADLLIVAYFGSKLIKYNMQGQEVTEFGYGHAEASVITALKWDTTPVSSLPLDTALKPTKKKLDTSNSTSRCSSTVSTPSKTVRVLVTGDDMGTLCLWNGDDMKQDGLCSKPLRILTTEFMSPISCIYIDAFKLVSGSDDGWIRMWDNLTGQIMHTLGNKIPKNAPVNRSDVSIMRVKNIWCNESRGVATIGHQVKTWDFAKQQLLSKSLKPKVGNAMRDRFKYEIGREVKESIHKLQSEKLEREQAQKHMDKLSLGGLTDEEMLDYAMMLSTSDHPTGDNEDEDLMKAVLASLELTDSTPTEQEEEVYHEYSSDEWPALGEQQEEMDQELRYILELSKTEK